MNKTINLNEALDNIEIRRNLMILATNRFSGKLIRRLAIIGFFIKKRLPFKAFINELMPGNRNSSQYVHLYFEKFAGEKFKSAIKLSNSFELFGKKLYYFTSNGHYGRKQNYEALLFSANSLVKMDQYHAREFVRKDSIVFDIGAACGLFSIVAAQIAKDGRVFAFEPSNSFSFLKKNALAYQNIGPYNLALGDKNGHKKFICSNKAPFCSHLEDSCMLRDDIDINNKTVGVKVETIDSFVKRKRISRVDFIKIDAEGYEKQILKGAKKTIKHCKPVIVTAAYHFNSDDKKIIRLVKNIHSTYKVRGSKINEKDLILTCRKNEKN